MAKLIALLLILFLRISVQPSRIQNRNSPFANQSSFHTSSVDVIPEEENLTGYYNSVNKVSSENKVTTLKKPVKEFDFLKK